ncbi:MAG: HupE/UreJ family protein [Pseudoruegeria sp.]
MIARVLLLVIALVLPITANSHALDPGYLSLSEQESDNWQIFFRKPDVQNAPMALSAGLPNNCVSNPPKDTFDGKAWISSWTVNCPGGITGQTVTIEGLQYTQTDTLLRVLPLMGLPLTKRLTAQEHQFAIPETFSSLQVFWNYLTLGFDHILEGLDHLLFVFALLVLVQTPRRLFGAVTAFTLAHSITLGLASFGLLNIPGPPVEAVIALSITFLALEILKQDPDKPTFTQRAPWVVAFSFGLLHGLGFAGALSEIGLPDGDIPLALLAFNVGVELGQLSFVTVVLAAYYIVGKILPQLSGAYRDPYSVATKSMGYAIGFVSLYWLMQRVVGFPIFAT